MDYGPPGSSVHWISQARILEWVATSFSRPSSNPAIEPVSPVLAGGFFTVEPPGKPKRNPTFCLFIHSSPTSSDSRPGCLIPFQCLECMSFDPCNCPSRSSFFTACRCGMCPWLFPRISLSCGLNRSKTSCGIAVSFLSSSR